MKLFRIFLFVSVALPTAWSAPALAQDTEAARNALEQRRAALRQALKPVPGNEVKDKAQTANNVPLARHLTPQELAALRQQLSQERGNHLKVTRP